MRVSMAWSMANEASIIIKNKYNIHELALSCLSQGSTTSRTTAAFLRVSIAWSMGPLDGRTVANVSKFWGHDKKI